MPTYEYRCDDCGHQFEAFQKITDDPIGTCPQCEGHVQKLIAATNFILKGGGWHKTDYTAPAERAAEKPACSPNADSPKCQGCPAANTD